MKNVKFKAWDNHAKKMTNVVNVYSESDGSSWWSADHINPENDDTICSFDEATGVLIECTGLLDKNGKEGYFDCDIWEVKDYEYRIPQGEGFFIRKCDLRFILKQGLLDVKCELINPLEGLDLISLQTIFNLPTKSSKRIFVDDNRQKLEIIGNKFENLITK